MKRLTALFLSSLFFFTTALPALAIQPEDVPPLVPEQNGDYPDPENPHLRVRVFVHTPKEKKPVTVMTTICSDPDSNSVVDKTGWKLPSGNWTYHLNPSSAPLSVGPANFATIAALGFDVYTEALSTSVSKPVFIRGTDTTVNRSTSDGKNILAWGRTSGTALGVTYVRYYPSTGLVVDVDTILNKKFSWSWTPAGGDSCGNPNSYDAQDILTHELGHWLGLDDEYTAVYINNTMYGYGSKNEIKKDTLTTGDKTGIKAVYP